MALGKTILKNTLSNWAYILITSIIFIFLFLIMFILIAFWALCIIQSIMLMFFLGKE